MSRRVRNRKLTCYVSELLYTLVHQGVVDTETTSYTAVAQYIEELILVDLKQRGILTEEAMAVLLGVPMPVAA